MTENKAVILCMKKGKTIYVPQSLTVSIHLQLYKKSSLCKTSASSPIFTRTSFFTFVCAGSLIIEGCITWEGLKSMLAKRERHSSSSSASVRDGDAKRERHSSSSSASARDDDAKRERYRSSSSASARDGDAKRKRHSSSSSASVRDVEEVAMPLSNDDGASAFYKHLDEV